MIPVKDHHNLYRDEKTGAIINTDDNGFAQYKKMKNAKLTETKGLQTTFEMIKHVYQMVLKSLKITATSNGNSNLAKKDINK